jgi:hypothetical protein
VATKKRPAAVQEPKSVERREAPRLRLPKVEADVVSLGVRAKVLDVGFGGVSIESEREFPIGEVHTLRARTSDPQAATLRVRVTHSRQAPSARPRPLYITGFEFVDPWCPGDSSAADEFISQVTRGLSKATRG